MEDVHLFLKKQSPSLTNIVQVFHNVDFVQVLKIVHVYRLINFRFALCLHETIFVADTW